VIGPHEERRLQDPERVNDADRRSIDEARDRVLEQRNDEEIRAVHVLVERLPQIEQSWRPVGLDAQNLVSNSASAAVAPIAEGPAAELIGDVAPSSELDQLARQVSDMRREFATARAEDVRWNKQRYLIAIAGLTCSVAGLGLGLLFHFLSGSGGNDAPPDVTQSMRTLADRLRDQSDADYWEGIAKFVESTTPRPTLADQVFFCSYTVKLFEYQLDTWTWDHNTDILAVVKQFKDLYHRSGDATPGVYRHIGTVKYKNRKLPRAIAAKYLGFALMDLIRTPA